MATKLGKIGILDVLIGGNADMLKRSLGDTNRALKSHSVHVRNAVNVVGKYALVAAAAGAAIFAGLVRRSMLAIDAQAKLARQLRGTIAGLETLNRAANFAGVGQAQMAKATKQLENSIGEAIQGTMEYKDAFDRLGVSAETIAELDVDERIRTINEALISNVPAAERAAVAGALFGRRVATAVASISTPDLVKARQEVEALGLAVSEVDATTIERANDAFSVVGEVVRGVSNRITVALAPLLEAVAQKIRAAAIESEGFKVEISNALDRATWFAGKFLDAVRGIQLALKGVQFIGQAVTAVIMQLAVEAERGITAMVNGAINGINWLVRQANKIPGVNIGELLIVQEAGWVANLEAMAESVRRTAAETRAEMERLSLEPLPSEGLKRTLDEIRAAADEISRKIVEARQAASGQAGGAGAVDPEAAKAAEKLRESLRTQEESERESHRKRLDELRTLNQKRALSDAEYHELTLRETARHNEALRALEDEKWKALEEERERRNADLESLRESLLTEEQLELESHARKLEQLLEAEYLELQAVEELQAMREALEDQHMKRLKEIREKGMTDLEKLQAMSLGKQVNEVATAGVAMLAAYGATNKKFAAAARIAGAAQAFIATLTGSAEALKLGWPAGPLAAAQIAAQGFGLVAAIKSASTSGESAHVTPTGQVAQTASQPLPGMAQQEKTVLIDARGDFFTGETMQRMMRAVGEEMRYGGRLEIVGGR